MVQVNSEIERAITAAAGKALEISGSYFKDPVTFHLANRYGKELELVALQPGKFDEALSDLVGTYSSGILEGLVMQKLSIEADPAKLHSLGFAEAIR